MAQVIDWCKKTYGAGALAVAAVVCVLTAAGPFFEIAVATGVVVLVKGRVLHIGFCLRARAALRAGIDRSMV